MLGGVIVGTGLGWRLACRRFALPCPVWLAWLLEVRWVEPFNRVERTMAPMALRRGMRVLDAGCGVGRVTVPLAEAVGEEGEVVALDLQQGMLDCVRARAEAAGLQNVRTLRQPLGGRTPLPEVGFDRIVLVTVLGEIPGRVEALRQLGEALAPDGLLVVTEALPDPHFQARGVVESLAREAGLTKVESAGPWYAYTMVLRRA